MQEAVMPDVLIAPRVTAPPAAPAAEREGIAVSVCIANWNCCSLLRRCMESLFDHDQGVTFEVIVVDNASTDGAAEMLEAEFPQVTLIRNADNRGFSVANNQAAAQARGRYFFFLNNDTVVPPGTLRQFHEFAEANPTVGMVGPRLRGGDGVFQISYRRRPTLGALLHRVSLLRWTGLFRRSYYDYRRDSFEPEGVRAVEVLMGAAVFLHRAVFEDSGRWDERYGFGVEDIDLSMQVGRRRPLVYVGDVEVVHYGRVSSRKNMAFVAPNVATGYVRYFRKAGTSPTALWIYKAFVTVDAPVQCLGKVLQGCVRLARGRTDKAKRSWLAARGLWHFMRTELVRFWKA
jgi:N-acetylglucosaminyl-diphospho-decaprenol L-rhamnosyltransferase